MNERQQVENDAQCVGDVVELLQAALDHHLHRESRSPADEEEQNDQNEHFDDLKKRDSLVLATVILIQYLGILKKFSRNRQGNGNYRSLGTSSTAKGNVQIRFDQIEIIGNKPSSNRLGEIVMKRNFSGDGDHWSGDH